MTESPADERREEIARMLAGEDHRRKAQRRRSAYQGGVSAKVVARSMSATCRLAGAKLARAPHAELLEHDSAIGRGQLIVTDAEHDAR